MRGYNVNVQNFVGCSHCSNTWYEDSPFSLGPAYRNGADYKYNACDRCYDSAMGKYRPGFERKAYTIAERRLMELMDLKASECLFDNLPDGATVLGIACPCPKHTLR